ncbi:unnamed protein product [Rotaria sp. Silwood2]|nr:unnamed protein product [Rotaria sp. Silwood2]
MRLLYYDPSTEKTIPLKVGGYIDIAVVKALIQDKEETPRNDQRLLFAGRLLEDGRTLSDYNIQKDVVLYMPVRNRNNKNVLAFNFKHKNHPARLSPLELQSSVLQGQLLLSKLFNEIKYVYASDDVLHLKNIILPNVADDEVENEDEEEEDEHNVLKDLLIEEEQIRLSQETQQLLSSIEDWKDIDWMDVIADLQAKLIKEAIGEDEIQCGLK